MARKTIDVSRCFMRDVQSPENISHIGIDPSVRDKGTGFCYLTADNVLYVGVMGLKELMNAIKDYNSLAVALSFEDSNSQKVNFSKYRSRKQVSDAGMNMGLSKVISAMRETAIAKTISISPQEKGRKRTHEEVKAIVPPEWTVVGDFSGNGSTGQDERDAIMVLIIGLHRLEGRFVRFSEV
jgi:hypothetical protein